MQIIIFLVSISTPKSSLEQVKHVVIIDWIDLDTFFSYVTAPLNDDD